MDIRVSGHQVDTGDALRTHVADRMGAIADKYFARAISAHVMQGVILKGSGKAAEAHPAFEVAADRVEKQLSRYMSRLRNRPHLAAQPAMVDEVPADADYRVLDAGDADGEPVDNPPIVAETKVDIPDASVSDAVMLLDLRNTNALLFRNSATARFNMVYRRGDGTIGWVEPQRD